MSSPDENPVLTQHMHLCWIISCSRCSTEQTADAPDDIGVAALYLQEEGWTATMKESSTKQVLDRFGVDSSAWPDQVPYILCPQCSKEVHGGTD